MKPQLPYRLKYRQLIGLAVVGIVILLVQIGLKNFKTEKPSPKLSETQFSIKSSTSETEIPLVDFNPNDLSERQWQQLGFTEKQVATILKYKQIVGGNFLSKEQLKKCYAISEEQFTRLEPYILLPEHAENRNYESQNYAAKQKFQLKISKPFNPDSFTQNDWIAMGFTEKQAASILKYKQYLGGSFQSQEKLQQCFIISEEQFSQMKPYLLLPKQSTDNNNITSKSPTETKSINYQKFNPNTLDSDGWTALGFSEKQASVILNYKNKKLGGSFRTLEDIERCFVISPEKFAELKPYIQLENISETPAKKTPKKTETPQTNFNKINLNEISYEQLMEFGFDKKTASGIISFRKNLGGFVNKNQLFETYGIDRDLAEKLLAVVFLNSENVPKYTLADAPENWLKTHPYFKYSADKIIFYRISYPDDKKIWKYLSAKPEYETKMKWYLK